MIFWRSDFVGVYACKPLQCPRRRTKVQYGKLLGVVSKIDTPEGCGKIELSPDRATAKDIRQACAVDPENTRKLLALVRRDSEPPYRRNRCGFAAILRGKK